MSSMKALEAQIMNLQSLADSTSNQNYTEMISYKKTQLPDLLGLKTQGALVRSRFLSIEQMDAPSKYFFSLEKKNGQKGDLLKVKNWRPVSLLCSDYILLSKVLANRLASGTAS